MLTTLLSLLPDDKATGLYWC